MKQNLWNLGHRKTRETIKYIEALQPHPSFISKEDVLFKKIQKSALTKLTANEMLEDIGFNPMGMDKIYDIVIETFKK